VQSKLALLMRKQDGDLETWTAKHSQAERRLADECGQHWELTKLFESRIRAAPKAEAPPPAAAKPKGLWPFKEKERARREAEAQAAAQAAQEAAKAAADANEVPLPPQDESLAAKREKAHSARTGWARDAAQPSGGHRAEAGGAEARAQAEEEAAKAARKAAKAARHEARAQALAAEAAAAAPAKNERKGGQVEAEEVHEVGGFVKRSKKAAAAEPEPAATKHRHRRRESA
jgi:hypothetical protein